MPLKLTIITHDGAQYAVETSYRVTGSELVAELLKILQPSPGNRGAESASFRLSSLGAYRGTLDLSRSLKQSDVKDGDQLLLWRKYPRQEQLRLERERLERLAGESEHFDFTAEANGRAGEPDEFTLRFLVRGITGVAHGGAPVYGAEHQVLVHLDERFPEERPLVRWKTPIWHPNVQHQAPRHVAIGAWWSPGQGLDALATLLLNMVQYKIYHAEFTPPYPLDIEVARWVMDYGEPNRIVDKSRGLMGGAGVKVLSEGTPLPAVDSPGGGPVPDKVTLFISHSSQDAALVELLANLLKSALGLKPYQIRCTSVDGYRLPVGAKTDETLRKEIQEAQLFIGLISASSIQSSYVLFELGARWGCGKHLAPLLAPASIPAILFGPLANLNALRCDSAPQLRQLVSDLAGELKITPSESDDSRAYIESIVNHAKA
jgi:ubiquitin-protein ligase